jgi:hypothetical protein
MKKISIFKMTLSAMFLALALVLPFLTGQIPEIGSNLSPMHIPVLLCGFVCGWPWGLAVGLIAPVIRSVIFGMPPLLPTALAMTFELAAYGTTAGLLYRLLPKKTLYVYAELILSMLIGRIIWGLVSVPIYSLSGKVFSLAIFWASGFINAIPGIILHIILVPAIIISLNRAKLIPLKDK